MDNTLQVNTAAEVQEVISLEEAAQQLGITYKALSNWLRSNLDIKNEYCFKQNYKGRRKTVIKVEGVMMIMAIKDRDRGNQTKNSPSDTFREGKKKMAKNVIQQARPSGIEALQQLQIVIAQQIEAYKQIEEHGQAIQSHEQRIVELEGDIEKMPISDGQKERLNERVRLLANKINWYYPKVWSTLHEAVGRRKLHQYTFQDYGRAIVWLKGVFKKNNINW